MAKTVDTSATSYCPADAAVLRIDWRTLADLCSDSGSRITNSATLQSNANFLALLLDASGEIESACLAAKRYRPADLAALTGAGQGKLYRLVCRLAVCLAYERRADIEMKQPWVFEAVDKDLRALRNGEEIFSFVETEDAGLPDSLIETPADVEARNGISFQVERMWGRRGNRRSTRSG
jgi:hypothetical protein